MKAPSKKMIVALIAVILIFVVIVIVMLKKETAQIDANVIFINESDVPVGSVQVSCPRWDGSASSETGMNADNSLMERGATLHFDAPGWPAVVTVCADLYGREALGSVTIEAAPPATLEEGCWYVIAQDGPEGLGLTLSLNLDEEELEQMEESISDNFGVDVTDGHISYCFYPGHGWQGDGEDFVTMWFSQEAAEELERQIAETEGWERFPVPEDLKESFVSVYDHESHIEWDEVSDSGWFYFRDEREGGTEPYDSSDYVAAVYDADTRLLYFFEWHQ